MNEVVVNEKKIVYVIMGPTGSGKTDLLTNLDPSLFEVISCDSRQVYRELEIGTAAPDAVLRQMISHHLIGILNPDQKINVSLFVELATESIRGILSRGRIPLLVGGSGFYCNALRTGLFQAPSNPEVLETLSHMDIREKREKLEELDPESLGDKNSAVIPPGKIHFNDEYRITRALEVVLSTGIPWSVHWSNSLKNKGEESGEFSFRGWIIDVEKESYYRMLEKRIHKMVDAGLLEETKRVMDRYGEDCPGLKSLGYNYAIEAVQGALGRKELENALLIAHRQYGKKQRTWFRREKDFAHLDRGTIMKHLETLQRHFGSGNGKNLTTDFCSV